MDTETDTDSILKQLLDDLGEVDVDYCGYLLIHSLAIITHQIHSHPEKALPSMIAQQRQLIRAYNGLKKPDYSFFS